MPEFIRVTDEVKPKREYSIVASSFIEGVHTKVNKPGAGVDGTPFPPKYEPEALAKKTAEAPKSDGAKA